MKRKLCALLLCGMAALTAAGQDQPEKQEKKFKENLWAIYVAPNFARLTNSQSDTGPFAFFGDNKTSGWFRGANLGVSRDFHYSPKIDLTGDFRLTFLSGNNAPLRSVLFGLRAAPRRNGKALLPYVEVMGGLGSTHAPQNSHSVHRGEWQVQAGVEDPINRHVDWRVIEVGYGMVRTIGSDAFSGDTSNQRPAAHVLNLTSGIVVRF